MLNSEIMGRPSELLTKLHGGAGEWSELGTYEETPVMRKFRGGIRWEGTPSGKGRY